MAIVSIGTSVRSRPDFARAAIVVAVILAVIVPILWMGARAYVETDRASAVLSGEQIAIDRLTLWQSLLFDLQQLRALSARSELGDRVWGARLLRALGEARALEATGIDQTVKRSTCGSTWREWQSEFIAWSRSPQRTAFANIDREADCFAIDIASTSGLVVDADSTVQVITSMIGYNATGLLRRLGDATSALEVGGKTGLSRTALIATSRSIGYIIRLQSNVDDTIQEDLARDDPALARALQLLDEPLSAAIGRFTRKADAALAAPTISPRTVAAIDELVSRAVNESQPLWTRGVLELRRRVAREQEMLEKRRYELVAFVAIGIVFALGVLLAAATMLSRRHRREVNRIALERDTLAARFAAERALSITEAQLRAVFESSLAAIAIFDSDLRVVQANAEFYTLTMSHAQLPMLAAELAATTFATLDRTTLVERCIESPGGPLWLNFSLAAVFDDQRCVYAIAMIRDITDSKVHEQRLLDESRRDPLTLLDNRSGFEEKLAASLIQARPFAVAFIDLDRFKPINDRFGHAAGDDVLVTIGARLRGAICASDTVARLGGDEFALLLADVADLVQAESIAQRITSAIEAPIRIGAVVVDVSASIGIAIAGEQPGSSGTDLVARADSAMYRAKTQRLGYVVARTTVAAHQ